MSFSLCEGALTSGSGPGLALILKGLGVGVMDGGEKRQTITKYVVCARSEI